MDRETGIGNHAGCPVDGLQYPERRVAGFMAEHHLFTATINGKHRPVQQMLADISARDMKAAARALEMMERGGREVMDRITAAASDCESRIINRECPNACLWPDIATRSSHLDPGTLQ